MLLADANGPGVEMGIIESPVVSENAEVATPMATQTTELVVPTSEPTPVTNTGSGNWLVGLILVIALVGVIVTLYLRNRK